MAEKIEDNQVYLSRMRKTFVDKAWFMRVLPEDVDTIIDFGCADGSFMEHLRASFPEYRYIGVECNREFREECQKRGFEVVESLEELDCGKRAVLVLSSVLHEIYTYADPEKFWDQVEKLRPKHIAIRDMHCTEYATFGTAAKRELEAAFMEAGLQQEWRDFEEIWGEVNDGHTATHLLMKYFYKENWDREVRENYLPFTFKDLHKALRKIGCCFEFVCCSGFGCCQDNSMIGYLITSYLEGEKTRLMLKI